MRFRSSNGITMLLCEPLNWRVEGIYHDGSGPENYIITLGDMHQMHICTFDPEKNILSISSMMYSSDEPPLKFKVIDEVEASVIVERLAIGMGYNTEETIYKDKPI